MNKLYAAVVLAMAALPLAAQTTQYVVTDLGSLGGPSPFGGPAASAQAINNAGQVAGSSHLPSGATRGFRTSPNSAINPATDAIPTLGGSTSSAAHINNLGQVAGSAQLANGDTHAIRVDADGSVHDLGIIGGTVDFSIANGLNDSGQVTGASWRPTPAFGPPCFGVGGSDAFLTSADSAIAPADDLGTLLSNCRDSDGYAVNNSGVVVGYTAFGSVFSPVQHAMMWSSSTGMIDLGVLGGVDRFPPVSGINATADAVNASGLITGYSTFNHDSSIGYSTYHAFLTTASGPMVDIGTLGGTFSMAFAINSAGQIVGGATTTGDAAIHGFLYTGAAMLDLNSMLGSASPWVIESASAINDNGQIAAAAMFSDGTAHGVRMDPANLAVTILTNLLSNPSLGLSTGQVSSFTDKLNNALASIRAGLNKQAVNQLNSLVSAVQTQLKAGKISSATANTLTAAANAIVSSLS